MSKILISCLKVCILIYAFVFVYACGSETRHLLLKSSNTDLIISAPAELVSLQEINVTPPTIRRMWEFKIEYLVRENSVVNAGDLLIEFDGQRLRTDLIIRQSEVQAFGKEAEQKGFENEAKLAQLVLDLAEAKKNKDIARRKVEITDTARSLIERKKQQAEFNITTELYVQAQQRIEQHKLAMQVNEQVQSAKISKAQSKLDEIKGNIDKLFVRAPKSGMVVLLPDEDDKKPAVGDTVFMGSRLIALPSLDKIAVKVEFDESFTSNINIGTQVQVTLDAFPERPFTGTISELGKTYRSKSQTNLKIVFDAWVTLDKLDLAVMRPGMKATVVLSEEAS